MNHEENNVMNIDRKAIIPIRCTKWNDCHGNIYFFTIAALWYGILVLDYSWKQKILYSGPA